MPSYVSNDDTGFDAALERYRGRVIDGLMAQPLVATTDPLKLAELEKLYVGGEFVLHANDFHTTVSSLLWGDSKFIYAKAFQAGYKSFAEIRGATYSSGSPKLMVIYRGMFIDLAYLWS